MKENRIGELLRICRERGELSQQELANKLFIDQAIVSKIENDRIPPSYSIVKEWAAATNCTDIIGMDFSGIEGWNKLKQLEDKFSKIKDLVNLMKVKPEGANDVHA